MFKTNASDPWDCKTFHIQSVSEWQSFFLVQLWVFKNDWPVCAKVSKWSFLFPVVYCPRLRPLQRPLQRILQSIVNNKCAEGLSCFAVTAMFSMCKPSTWPQLFCMCLCMSVLSSFSSSSLVAFPVPKLLRLGQLGSDLLKSQPWIRYIWPLPELRAHHTRRAERV